MPRRVFKKLNRHRHALKERWFMRPFHQLLDDPAYWCLNRRNVARAFALGLFLSFVPLPGHLIMAPAFAVLARLNIAATVAGVLLTNPFTMVPLYFIAYWVGCRLLQLPLKPFDFQMTWDWISTALLPIWKPFLLGCMVMGLLTAITGYVLLAGIWHLNLVIKYRRRKRT
jgi:uncharacterized protein (DUF2062 family)